MELLQGHGRTSYELFICLTLGFYYKLYVVHRADFGLYPDRENPDVDEPLVRLKQTPHEPRLLGGTVAGPSAVT